MIIQTLNPAAPSAVPNVPADQADFRAIARQTEPRSTVFDLGCGDGSLLHALQDEPGVLTYGIEIDDASVLASTQKGVRVIQQNTENKLVPFEDESFNTAILLQALQIVRNTAQMLREILHMGRECIVPFPNFGHWPHRLSIFRGRMSMSKSLPYKQYNTPNVRVLIIRDFEALAPRIGLVIFSRVVLHEGNVVRWGANWRGSVAVYQVRVD